MILREPDILQQSSPTEIPIILGRKNSKIATDDRL